MPRYSSRLPGSFEPNEYTRLLDEKRRSGAELIDLTESNPTRVGLEGALPDDWAGAHSRGDGVLRTRVAWIVESAGGDLHLLRRARSLCASVAYCSFGEHQ